MAMAYGKESMETAILASGSTTRRMDTDSMSGRTETSMRASGICVYAMDRAQTSLRTATCTLENTPMEEPMATVSTDGQTVTHTRASSWRV